MGKELVERINTRALVLCSTNSSSSANSTIIFLQEHTPTYSFAQVVYQGLIIPLGSWVGHDTQAWPVRAPHTSGHREHSRHLGWEDPLEEEVATHSSILAWRISTDRGAWLATVL